MGEEGDACSLTTDHCVLSRRGVRRSEAGWTHNLGKKNPSLLPGHVANEAWRDDTDENRVFGAFGKETYDNTTEKKA